MTIQHSTSQKSIARRLSALGAAVALAFSGIVATAPSAAAAGCDPDYNLGRFVSEAMNRSGTNGCTWFQVRVSITLPSGGVETIVRTSPTHARIETSVPQFNQTASWR